MNPTVVNAFKQEFLGQAYWPMPPRGYYRRRKKWLHRMVWEYHNGPIPAGWQIHHRDRNPANNQPDNLEALAREPHRARHWSQAERELARGRMREREPTIQDKARAWHRSPEGRAWHRAHGRSCMARRASHRRACEFCQRVFDTQQSRARFCHQNCKMKFYRREGRIP